MVEASLLPTPTPIATVDQPIAEQAGSQIGPYKLLEEIGQGGMGVVYMAEQHDPVRRKVALKIIKPGMDTRQLIAHFEAERQSSGLSRRNMGNQCEVATGDSGGIGTQLPESSVQASRRS